MLLKPEDLETELFPEAIRQITRGNSAEITTQIKAAEDYAKGYLFKYDLKALFGVDATETQAAIPPTHPDENLKKVIKIIASYWLIRKSNTGANLNLFRDDWMLLIGTKSEPGWLTDVKEGRINPEWPYRLDDTNTGTDESTENIDVNWNSNIKRTQHI